MPGNPVWTATELHVFPNCGHWIMLEAKDAFERTALEFLQR
ncbi:alpha/beta fold hydrolase [Nocardia tengchongensis]